MSKSLQVSFCQNGTRHRVIVPDKATAQALRLKVEAARLEGKDIRSVFPVAGSANKEGHNGPVTGLHALARSTYDSVWCHQRTGEASLAMAHSCVRALANQVTDLQSLRVKHFIGLQQAFKSKGLGPATINRKIGTLGSMVTHAVNMGLIRERITYKRLTEPEGRTRVLSLEEEQQIFDTVGGDDKPIYSMLCRFLVETGLRMQEALDLNWVNINSTNVVIKRTKTGKPRVVPLTHRAQSILIPLGNIDGGPFHHINYDRFIRAWRQAKRELHLEGDSELVPHALRHTCATRLLQAGVDLATVAAWLGDTMDTVQRYVHADAGSLNRAREVMDGLR